MTNASYPGNRGIYFEMWNSSSFYTNQLAEVLDFNHPPVVDGIADFFSFDDTVDGYMDSYNSRYQGYFVPPSDNDYMFFVKGDDTLDLYFSPLSGQPDDKVRSASK